MAQLIDWVKQTVASAPGLGDIPLGDAVANYIRFQDDDRITDGSQVYYTVVDGVNKERGIGTYTATGAILARTIIHAKMENGTFTKNPGTGLTLSSAAIVTCTAVSNTHNFRGALVYYSGTYTLPDNTQTTLSWNAESYDTDGFHDNVTNNSRLTIPAGVSKIIIKAQVRFAASAVGRRYVNVSKNGNANYEGSPFFNYDAPTVAGSAGINISSAVLDVIPGDYFEIAVLQNSGGNLDLDTNTLQLWFSIEVIE